LQHRLPYGALIAVVVALLASLVIAVLGSSVMVQAAAAAAKVFETLWLLGRHLVKLPASSIGSIPHLRSALNDVDQAVSRVVADPPQGNAGLAAAPS